MFNSNQEIIEIGEKEYTLTLNRKGIEAIEKYTHLKDKADGLKELAKNSEINYIDEISLDEDPFANTVSNEEEKMNEVLELAKRVLWICLWDTHHLNIDEVRELLIKIIDENKLDELNGKMEKLIQNATKEQTSNEYLKNMKALKAQK